MRFLICLFLFTISFASSALDVSFKCTGKAFTCYNGPAGYECRWNPIFEGPTLTLPLKPDEVDPNRGWAYYQTNLDGHQLTLDFRYNQANRLQPLKVKAYLAASNVMAESSGTESIDIALRNNSYGRGFVCSPIRVIN